MAVRGDAMQGLPADAGRRAEPSGRSLAEHDAIDLAVIQALQENGRVPNAHIARMVGVSEPTIRKRIDRLMAEGTLKVVAVLDPRRSGYQTNVLIGVRVQPGRMREVGRKLAELPDVVWLGYVTGRYDILAEFRLPNDGVLLDFLQGTMTELDGILSTETYHVLSTEKIDYDWKLPVEFVTARRGAARADG
jgi:Lrp/AsnC family transcriptional regulator for asnA, asnC and gidA